MAPYNPQKTLSLLERTLTAEPTTSLRALTALRAELEVLERHLVARALQEGQTYTQIARPLGISRQAAHRRYRDLTTTHRAAHAVRRRARRARARARGGGATRLAQHRRRAPGAGPRPRGCAAARRGGGAPELRPAGPQRRPSPQGCTRRSMPASCAIQACWASTSWFRRRCRIPARGDCSTSSAGQSTSLCTVAQLRTVAVPPPRPGLLRAFIRREFCMPSGHHA